MAQALVRLLAAQSSELDGREAPLFAGVFAIFGHGNVAGLGEALYAARERLPTLRAHNEQAMALAAIGFAKATRRRHMMVCTSSIGLHDFGCNAQELRDRCPYLWHPRCGARPFGVGLLHGLLAYWVSEKTHAPRNPVVG